jgi:hypothetical protein
VIPTYSSSWACDLQKRWANQISKARCSIACKAFMLELGHGFCFEARQKRIQIGDTDCFIDLVFYHRILKCHVLIELKVADFSHEHLGQLNTYVSWYKRNMITNGDNPPIGLLLCKRKDNALVHYALADLPNPLFVSKYQVELPTVDQLRQFLDDPGPA